MTGWLLRRSWLSCAAAVLVLSIAKYGIGLMPSWNYMQALAENWRDPLQSPLLQPPADYRLRNPVSAVLAGWLHLTTGPNFLGFHLVLTLLAIVVPFAMPAVRRSAELRLLVAILLVGGAIPAVLLDWIGSYDPVTIGAAAVAALAVRRDVAAIAWFVFAFNNAPEAAIAVAVMAVVAWFDEGVAAVHRIAFWAAGAVLGFVAIRVLDSHWGQRTSDFTLLKFYGWSRLWNGAVKFWPLVVLSALGVGWLLVTSREARALPGVRAFTVLAALATVVVPFIALDESRITAGALWAPMLFTAALIVRRVPADAVRRLVGRLAPAALLVVIVLAWDGSLVYAGWRSLATFLGYLSGGTQIPVSS